MCDSFSELSVWCCVFCLFVCLNSDLNLMDAITLCFLFAVMKEDPLDHVIAHLVIEN